MIDSNVARRYARALLAQAGIQGSLEAIAEQLALVSEGIVHSEARSLLAPGAPRAQQSTVVESLAPKLDKSVADLLRLLVERNRFDGLLQISAAFSRLVDEKLGRVRATIRTPQMLDDAEVRELAKALSARTGKQISVETRLDESLIGGIAAEVGGLLFDGSVKTQLETLRRDLKAPRA